MLRLASAGKPDVPARTILDAEIISGEARRLVNRHQRHSGAVSLDWLLEQDTIAVTREELVSYLQASGFEYCADDWLSRRAFVSESTGKNDVFHNTIVKMSTYCGPVSVDDIYFGLARVLSRYEMPVPQPELLERILCNNGYIHEDGLWYWADGETVDLSQGEYLILETIATNAGVAHFSQLARAITEDGLHYASVAGTLSRSPLFDNFAYGLYKLRGTSPSHQSIEDARASSDDIPVDLKYEYDVGGSIVVEAKS